MQSVRTARLVAKGKKPRVAPESIEQREARFAASTLRLFVDAFRAGQELPHRDAVHRHFYEAAKVTKQWSEKGNKAWASLQVEELRRTAVAQLEAESHRSRVASSKGPDRVPDER
jgi:hypothetical protein